MHSVAVSLNQFFKRLLQHTIRSQCICQQYEDEKILVGNGCTYRKESQEESALVLPTYYCGQTTGIVSGGDRMGRAIAVNSAMDSLAVVAMGRWHMPLPSRCHLIL